MSARHFRIRGIENTTTKGLGSNKPQIDLCSMADLEPAGTYRESRRKLRQDKNVQTDDRLERFGCYLHPSCTCFGNLQLVELPMPEADHMRDSSNRHARTAVEPVPDSSDGFALH